MAATTFSGPIRVGDKDSSPSNVGSAVVAQRKTVAFDNTLVQSAEFRLPPNASLVDVFADPTVVYNSATSATLSLGTAAAGTQYGGSMDVRTAGRKRPTLSAAQSLAMANIGANTSLFATVTSVGQPSAGSVDVVVLYTLA